MHKTNPFMEKLHKQRQRQITNWEKMLAIYIIDKGLISLILKELSNLESRKRLKIDLKMGIGHEQ